MNELFQSARNLHDFLSKEKIPYAIIGGIALQYWGEPRFTRDIDVTILTFPGSEEEAIKKILSAFAPRISGAMEFALRNRVLLVRDQDGSHIDISLGIPGYEDEVVARARNFDIGGGNEIKICSAEDLVIHKAVAGRAKDIEDIEGILIRQGKKLDLGYIRKWLKEFSLLLETDEVIERFERSLKSTLK